MATLDTQSMASSAVSSAKSCLTTGIQGILGSGFNVSSIMGSVSFDDVTALAKGKLDEILPDLLSKAEGAASQLAKEEDYLKSRMVEQKIVEVHDNQDAKKSVARTEAVQAELGVSTVQDLGNQDYSNKIDYPESYGQIDDANNWLRVNQATGEAEIVHNSGSYIKLDKAGNCTINITGGLKFIVANDTLFQTTNFSEIVKGSFLQHVFGNSTENVDGTYTNSALSTTTLKSAAVNNIKGSVVNIN